MHYIEVKGYRVPALGLGTWRLRGEVCRQVVDHALGLGYRSIDTAQAYDNEAEVGRAIAGSGLPREELFITTKLWPDSLTPDSDVLDESLGELGLDYVDLLLLHWPSEDQPLADLLLPLVRALEDRKARLIGVSNFPSALFRQALTLAPLACNQVEYHPYLSQRQLLDVIRERELMLTAYCPLARGEIARDPTIDRIARTYGKTKSQVTLRWLLQQERVAAIPRSSRFDHLAENIAIFDFSLSPSEMAAMDGLAYGKRMVDPEFGPAWDKS
ncbi:aldo/keto reductase [Haliangium sp.]|uniref:aldo/keto reductase n=1 Tax=Haliangium sp. TaxID=2663208 RepID=UPI003D141A4A